jgi:hypothetical protein
VNGRTLNPSTANSAPPRITRTCALRFDFPVSSSAARVPYVMKSVIAWAAANANA